MESTGNRTNPRQLHPRSAPARDPPLWEAPIPARTGHAPPRDPLTQAEPVYEFDRRRGYLALWMSYEDLIRVADPKTRRARLTRLRADVDAKAGEPVVV